MVLSREIDIKLCQNYTKTYVSKIYVRITWPELPHNPWQCSILVTWYRRGERDNNTALPLVAVLVTWSGRINIIINYIYWNKKLLNSNNIRSTPEFFRLLWDIVVFRLVAYLLNMICLILRILYKILHIYVLV